MANQELIYQLTKAVYQRLGPGAEAGLVESLVTDIYRIVEGDGAATAATDAGGPARVVISAFGVSRPGIVAAITRTLAEAHCNIVDMNQTVVQGKFAMVLIAETGAGATDLAALTTRLNEAGERAGVRVYAQREDLFKAMHRV